MASFQKGGNSQISRSRSPTGQSSKTNSSSKRSKKSDKGGQGSRSSSQSSTSSSRSRSRSSSRSSCSSSTSTCSESGDETKRRRHKYKNKTLPTQPQLPVKSLSHPRTTVQNLPKFTMHLQQVNSLHTSQNPLQSAQNTVMYNSPLVAQRTPTIANVQKPTVVTTKSSIPLGKAAIKEQITAQSSAYKNPYKAITPNSVSSTSTTKSVTTTSSSSQSAHIKRPSTTSSANGVKFIAGLQPGSLSSQTVSGMPVHMAIMPQNSNVIPQGYQILTLTTPNSKKNNSNDTSTTKSSSSEKAKSVLANSSVSKPEQRLKVTSASNMSKYTAVLNPNPSSQSVVDTSQGAYTDLSKHVANIHTLNSSGGIPIHMFNNTPSFVQMANYRPANQQPSSSAGSALIQTSLSNSINQPKPPQRPHSQQAPTHGSSHTPIPRIFTPTPSGNSASLITEIPRDQIAGTGLLIQSNLAQLSSNPGFAGTRNFSHQPFNTAVIGVRPDQAGDGRHTIRLQEYQGLPAQRLTMYQDQAGATTLRPNFPVYRAGGTST